MVKGGSHKHSSRNYHTPQKRFSENWINTEKNSIDTAQGCYYYWLAFYRIIKHTLEFLQELVNISGAKLMSFKMKSIPGMQPQINDTERRWIKI